MANQFCDALVNDLARKGDDRIPCTDVVPMVVFRVQLGNLGLLKSVSYRFSVP